MVLKLAALPNLEKRLAAYAASAVAGASLLATTSTAEAKVVYTPAHLEITEDLVSILI